MVRDRQWRHVVVLRDDEDSVPRHRAVRPAPRARPRRGTVRPGDLRSPRSRPVATATTSADARDLVGRGAMPQRHVDADGRAAAVPASPGRPHTSRGVAPRGVPQLPAELVRRPPRASRRTRTHVSARRAPSRPARRRRRAGYVDLDRRPRALDLVAGARVHGAGEAQPLDVPPADALVATDARTDLGDPALPRLTRGPPSAMWARAIPTMSAWPAASTRSATSGSLIRPVWTTGSERAALSSPASWRHCAGSK